MRISWLMGLTHPPEQEGAICNFGSELPAGSASCSHSIPCRGMQLFTSSLGSLQPFQQKLPARSRDLAQLAPSSAPFPAFPSCLAMSSSCAWRLIDCPGEWGCVPLPKGSFPASRDFWDPRNQEAFCLGYKLLDVSTSRKKRDPTGSHTPGMS